MRSILRTLFITVPFLVASCSSGNSTDITSSQKDLKEIIRANNANADIKWIDIDNLDDLMKENPKKVMLFFYRPGCPYCKEMKETTLSDPTVIKLLNDHFYAVMFDGRGKESVTLNGVVYENPEQSIEVKSNHDLHEALVDPYNKNFYWPSTVFLNENYEKLRSYPGLQKPVQFPRVLQNMINR